MSNLPRESLRWSIYKGAIEFGCDKSTLANKLTAAGINPGEDGCYTTCDLHSALSGGSVGDLRSERKRESKARADYLELKNAKLRGELLPAVQVKEALEDLFRHLRAEIMGASGHTNDEKRSLLNQLAGFKIPGKS